MHIAGATGMASTAMAVLLSQQNFNVNFLFLFYPEMPPKLISEHLIFKNFLGMHSSPLAIACYMY